MSDDTPVLTDGSGPGEGPGGRIEPVEIEDELQRSYLDYAMSVIVGRALPDVRDGLKPVHRRILFSMFEGGMRAGTQHRKSAAAVGDVMKKYHPHGDSSIYDALVRMGQPWAIRYPLIDGHGNFGSVDGDPAAAMRYTESRLSGLAMELLRDIDEDTVDFAENYDGQESEPVILPSRFPNLLVNGSSGIAVGMATNVPPHNLVEMTNAVIATMGNPDITLDELMQFVPGPDFPTGASIMGVAGIRDAYETGRGSIRMRAISEVEETPTGERIVVTELPYQVNKAHLARKIAELVDEKRITGIRNLEDQSNRLGMKLVIELKRDANAQVILNQLYKMTQLQDTFGVINLSLVESGPGHPVPRTLSLKATILNYIRHQVEIVTRRTRYRLRKAQERAHVLEGLIVALDHLDEVIALIRAAPSAEAALGQLQSRFGLSEIQARAILDMQLRRLAALERQRILDEYAELQTLIAELQAILADPARVREIITTELTELRDKFGDARRTRILPSDGDMDMEDLIAEEDVVVTLTQAGYVKRVNTSEYRLQRRGGRGVAGTSLKSDDIVRDLFVTTTHHWLLFFTNQGRMYRVKAYQIPDKGRTARGTYVANVEGLALQHEETIAAVLDLKSLEEDAYLFFATKKGMVKRTALREYNSPRSVLIAINLRDDDELIGVQVTSGSDEVMLVSRKAMSIRFPESDARFMGRDTTGVRGMSLARDDEVLSMTRCVDDGQLLVVTEEGYGKRTPLERYPIQRRGGKGVRTATLVERRGGLVGALVAAFEQQIFIVTDIGTVIRMDVKDINPTGRATQGVRVMKPSEGAKVASIAVVMDDEGLLGEDDDDVVELPDGASEGPSDGASEGVSDGVSDAPDEGA